MSVLTKEKKYTVIPGTPGSSYIPGTPGHPGTPGYYSITLVDVLALTLNSFDYDRPDQLFVRSPDPGNSIEFSQSYGHIGYPPPVYHHFVKVPVYTWHDEVPGTPASRGVPGTPGTPAQITEHLNEGWNSNSVSIAEFPVGAYLSYYVHPGVRGVLISLGVEGMKRERINAFSHSILVDPDGIKIFENGDEVRTMRPTYTAASEVRLYRQSDQRVICTITTGQETLLHIFDAVDFRLSGISMYAYAHLYLGGDSLHSAKFTNSEVHFGAA